MKKTAFLAITAFLCLQASVMATGSSNSVNTEMAQKMLLEGNKRYSEGKPIHPNQNAGRRMELAQSQKPFAVILSCSDSRVPPEILFDQGIGDLFVIRIAGNILTAEALGSIEYAVEHLGVSYIMVLGHERCGAVSAAVKGGEAPGHIGSLVKAIQPAVSQANNKPGDVIENAVEANVGIVVQQLKTSVPILKEFVEKSKITVVGARYDLDDGIVAILK
ncbi:MAG: carbonic anhydrase [Thermodesulfobacteriota bacterium]